MRLRLIGHDTDPGLADNARRDRRGIDDGVDYRYEKRGLRASFDAAHWIGHCGVSALLAITEAGGWTCRDDGFVGLVRFDRRRPFRLGFRVFGNPKHGRIKMAGNAEKIIELDRQRMTSMAEKDVAALAKILSDDLVYTHSSARLDTKQSLIGGMESGSTVYTSIEPSEVVAQDLGDAVVLTGVAAISVNSGGKANSFRVRFTDVYANKGGQWQMVTWQSTKLA